MKYDPVNQTRSSTKTGPAFWLITLVGLAVWTLLMWFAYAISDAVIVWISGNGAALAEAGKGLIGAEVATLLNTSKLDQVASTGVGLLQSLLGPALGIIWAIGAVAILFLRSILTRIIGMRGSMSR
ncbi:hypothetical protein [Brucella haematophila]|uniref:Uncharacterized protein n=1 Tax=Brucella haematophila TaxID=419474 RepID=A0ABX1DL12_9HYPH|nr:hypothetical protein [Brucella haematophila]NKC03674.1 hypothetical protein [Brucella haematophila]TMU96066.1 hypothetical protein FGI60_18625 [Brucella haematophila]